MDDKEEYQKLLKIEAEEQRDYQMVDKIFKIIIVLLIIGISVSLMSQVIYFLEVRAP